MFLEVWLSVVEDVLDESCQEYWQCQQDEQACHKPDHLSGVVGTGGDMVDEQRDGHYQKHSIEGGHCWPAPSPPLLPARPVHTSTLVHQVSLLTLHTGRSLKSTKASIFLLIYFQFPFC